MDEVIANEELRMSFCSWIAIVSLVKPVIMKMDYFCDLLQRMRLYYSHVNVG